MREKAAVAAVRAWSSVEEVQAEPDRHAHVDLGELVR